MKHVMIVGTGRSGSNRLLDILDVHETTNCRNEIHRFDTPVGKLSRVEKADADQITPDVWNDAVAQAELRQSIDDRKTLVGKSFTNSLAPVAYRLVHHTKLRHLLWSRQEEWDIPGFALAKDAKALPVFKVLGRHDSLVAIHKHLPEQSILHVIRDPRAYLKSWWNRLVLQQDGAEGIYPKVKEIISDTLREHDQPPMADDFDLAELLRGELWILRERHAYLNTAFRESNRYDIFPYEDTSANPVADGERAFALAGLTMTDTHRDRIAQQKNTLFAKAHSDTLDKDLVEKQVKAVLHDSPVFERYLA